uniref:Uncharacterized protein n=1 Tax=Rhizophora mucronata TaxID=61149 RepID=A0A2P2ISU4_RHIMU
MRKPSLLLVNQHHIFFVPTDQPHDRLLRALLD